MPRSRLLTALSLLGVLVATLGRADQFAVPAIDLQPIITSGLTHSVYVATPPDGTRRLFIVEQPGRIRIVKDGKLLPKPFVDLTGPVRSTGMEQGLLGLAFHPHYRENGRYFVQYTRNPDGAIVVAELRVSDDPDLSRPPQRVLLTVPHPYTNHNAGMIEFGRDGALYVGMGDGGSRGDPDNRAQNVHELLGKMLRIDVDRDGQPEIFAWGLRNPWRFSFDRKTGELWVGDVGQNAWEEIDVVERGRNYGWRIMEGRHCYQPARNCPTDGLTLPIAEYPNRSPRCSITGGYIYRGTRVPALAGWYVFGDYCSGEVMGLSPEDRGTVHVLLKTSVSVSSFGEDADGELFVVDHQGAIYQIRPATR